MSHRDTAPGATSPAAPGAGGDLQLVEVAKRFGDFVAVDDLTLTVPQGSFFALLGPSGCGKTTTLRMVAGLEQPTQGRILVGGDDITSTKPYKRQVNTVFQSYALFPHLDVFENVAFGLRRRGRQDVQAEVERMLELVELSPMARRKPAQLSGGQQQRVAVGRALINRPGVLLLDEPLGALDLKLRRQMQLELKRIQTEVGITFVHVTHDQEEAMTMADTIAVMNAGRIEQMGPPTELYENPLTTFVANFLGQSNLMDGRIEGRDGDTSVASVQGHRLALPTARVHAPGADVHLGVRPEKIAIRSAHDAATAATTDRSRNRLEGTVADSSFIGVSTEYLVRLPWGQAVTVFAQNVDRDVRLVPGARVVLEWDPANTFALDASESVVAGLEPEVTELHPAGVLP
ncbi:MAG TPA: ABC transporter ATP-binding protein [Jiangellales bacterium]|nr:ABC transporter ATP-binding protein [Jiangellales bacterium]